MPSEKSKVLQNLLRSLEKFLSNDRYLIEHDLNERTIQFRVALYLQEQFEDFHVDCEYNRNMEDTKRLAPQDRGIYPDIIVHRRGSNEENILIVEIKKSNDRRGSDGQNSDKERIENFCNHAEYRYKYGAFIVFTLTSISPCYLEFYSQGWKTVEIE